MQGLQLLLVQVVSCCYVLCAAQHCNPVLGMLLLGLLSLIVTSDPMLKVVLACDSRHHSQQLCMQCTIDRNSLHKTSPRRDARANGRCILV